MGKEKKEQNYLSSVKHAMKMLRLFHERQNELSVTEIAAKLNIPASSAHLLIKSLTKEGFLSQNPRTKKYRLGLSLLTLGGVIFSHKELYKEAAPVVQRLVHKLEETAQICLLENEDVVYLFRTECQNPVRLITQIGRKNPVHCTSEGLAILAFQDEKTIHNLLDKELHAFTPYTLTDRTALKKELEIIRTQKYAIAKDTYFEGFVGIAAPIYDHTEQVVSSISVIGPTSRIPDSRYPFFIEHITKSAREISKLLGYYG